MVPTFRAPDIHPAAPWLWAALSLIAFVVSCFGALAIAGAAASWGLGRDVDGLALRLDLALFLVLTCLSGMAGILGAARIAFGRWSTVTGTALLVPLIGAVLAPAVEVALHEWASVSIGGYDWDFVGLTAGLSLMVILVGLASFAVQIAPAPAIRPPLVGLTLGAAVVVLIVLSNLPALSDGIGPHSGPLAVLVGLSAVHALGALVIGLRTALAR